MTRFSLHVRWWLGFGLAMLVAAAAPASAQTPQSREEVLRQAKAEKAKALSPYVPSKAEQWVNRIEDTFLDGDLRWHPFFQSALAGGGFTLGAGYRFFVSPYNTVDLRGSYVKQVEAAGFRFAGESKVLENPKDPLNIAVFDKSIRGRTSQFAFKFVKPD